MRALVVGAGGLRGAYDAGVLRTLCKKMGADYFDAVYMSSVGVFAGTFYAANQPDTIEHTWRNYVDGQQLVNYLNPFRGREILDLEYLIHIFHSHLSHLDTEKLFRSKTKLFYAVEDYYTGKVKYLQPTPKNIFDLMRAATAVPFVHSPVVVENQKYFDAGFVDPLPYKKALEDGYANITVVCNKSKYYHPGIGYRLFDKFLAQLLPDNLGKQMLGREKIDREINEDLERRQNLQIIRPDRHIAMSILNTNKKTINNVFDLGIKDAKKILKNIGNHENTWH